MTHGALIYGFSSRIFAINVEATGQATVAKQATHPRTKPLRNVPEEFFPDACMYTETETTSTKE